MACRAAPPSRRPACARTGHFRRWRRIGRSRRRACRPARAPPPRSCCLPARTEPPRTPRRRRPARTPSGGGPPAGPPAAAVRPVRHVATTADPRPVPTAGPPSPRLPPRCRLPSSVAVAGRAGRGRADSAATAAQSARALPRDWTGEAGTEPASRNPRSEARPGVRRGAAFGIRTRDLRITSALLWPTELRRLAAGWCVPSSGWRRQRGKVYRVLGGGPDTARPLPRAAPEGTWRAGPAGQLGCPGGADPSAPRMGLRSREGGRGAGPGARRMGLRSREGGPGAGPGRRVPRGGGGQWQVLWGGGRVAWRR